MTLLCTQFLCQARIIPQNTKWLPAVEILAFPGREHKSVIYKGLVLSNSAFQSHPPARGGVSSPGAFTVLMIDFKTVDIGGSLSPGGLDHVDTSSGDTFPGGIGHRRFL